MMKQLALLASLALVVFACNTAKKSTADANASAPEGQVFGATFQPANVVAFADLDKQFKGQDTIETTVKGLVNGVCQVKGCWMTMTNGNADDDMMIRFKDYGFFMPKDIAGREVILHGKAFVRTTPVEELRHYAEDAGKSPEEIAKITEPKTEMSFLADGVILLEQ